jgi:hypothetical protein
VISSSQRPLPDNTRHSQQTNIHAPRGIRTQDAPYIYDISYLRVKSEGIPRLYLLFRMQPERTIRANLLDTLLSPDACYADLLTQ